MPMWGGHWFGFGWVFPLVGLLFLVVMVLTCVRGMGGGMGQKTSPTSGEIEDLRREIRELKEEIRQLRPRT